MLLKPLSDPYFVMTGVNGLLREETQHPVLSWHTANSEGCRVVWSTRRGGSCGGEGLGGRARDDSDFAQILRLPPPGAVVLGIGHHFLSVLLPSQGLEIGRRLALPPTRTLLQASSSRGGCGRGGQRLSERHTWKGREVRALTECPNPAFPSACTADQRLEAERGERGLQLVPQLPPRRDRASRCGRRCPGALCPLPPGRPLPCAQLPPRSQRNREPAPPQSPPLGTTAALLGPFLHRPGQFAARLQTRLLPFVAALHPSSAPTGPAPSVPPALPGLRPRPSPRQRSFANLGPAPGRSGPWKLVGSLSTLDLPKVYS